jgi:hypothetical protein
MASINLLQLPDHIQDKIIPVTESGCWLWTAGGNGWGYGSVKVGKKSQLAHHAVYCFFHGPLPRGTVLRHSCDIPHCVNPEHLEPGTHADNVADRVSRARSARGTRNGRSKLTADQVRDIRSDTVTSNADVGRKFGVDTKAIAQIRARQTWNWLEADTSSSVNLHTTALP